MQLIDLLSFDNQKEQTYILEKTNKTQKIKDNQQAFNNYRLKLWSFKSQKEQSHF